VEDIQVRVILVRLLLTLFTKPVAVYKLVDRGPPDALVRASPHYILHGLVQLDTYAV
jgi:hypothetical protein